MDEDISAPSGESAKLMDGLGWAGLAIAAPFYLLSLLFVLTFERQNPEDGMLVGFVMLEQIPLWLGLAMFLWSAVRRARLERGIAVGAAILFVLCAIAAFLSFGVMDTDPNWLSVVPLLLPLLTVLFGFWAMRTAGQPNRRQPALLFAATALVLLTLFAIAHVREEARVKEGIREYEVERARYEAEFQAHLRSETRLDGLLEYLTYGDDHQERALAAIRRLPSRQADAVRLLESGRSLWDLDRLHDFGLQPTPELCAAYLAAFNRFVDGLGRPAAEGSIMPMHVEQQGWNIDWLLRNGCDLSAPLRRAASRIREMDQGYGSALADRLEAAANQVVPPPE